jgi:hypothetical protein
MSEIRKIANCPGTILILVHESRYDYRYSEKQTNSYKSWHELFLMNVVMVSQEIAAWHRQQRSKLGGDNTVRETVAESIVHVSCNRSWYYGVITTIKGIARQFTRAIVSVGQLSPGYIVTTMGLVTGMCSGARRSVSLCCKCSVSQFMLLSRRVNLWPFVLFVADALFSTCVSSRHF